MALVTGSLSSTGDSSVVNLRGPAIVTLSGTWTGTVKVQRRRRGAESTWVDVINPDTGSAYSFTGNGSFRMKDDVGGDYRLDFTKSTGTLVYDIESLH